MEIIIKDSDDYVVLFDHIEKFDFFDVFFEEF